MRARAALACIRNQIIPSYTAVHRGAIQYARRSQWTSSSTWPNARHGVHCKQNAAPLVNMSLVIACTDALDTRAHTP